MEEEPCADPDVTWKDAAPENPSATMSYMNEVGSADPTPSQEPGIVFVEGQQADTAEAKDVSPNSFQGTLFKWATAAIDDVSKRAEEINNYESVKQLKQQTAEAMEPVRKASLPYWEKTVEYTNPALQATSDALETTKQYSTAAYNSTVTYAGPIASEAAERTKIATSAAYESALPLVEKTVEKTKEASVYAAENMGPALNTASTVANQWCGVAYSAAEQTSAQLHNVLGAGTDDKDSWKGKTPSIDEDFIHVPAYHRDAHVASDVEGRSDPTPDSSTSSSIDAAKPEVEEQLEMAGQEQTSSDEIRDESHNDEQDSFL